jgi:HSP20 family protein
MTIFGGWHTDCNSTQPVATIATRFEEETQSTHRNQRRRTMKVTKYVAPVSPLDAVFDRLGFGFPAIDRYFGNGAGDTNGGWTSVRLPRTNVQENDNAFVFTLEMPGLTRENIEVNVEGDTLVVKGSKSDTTESAEDKGHVHREFSASRFERTIHVGDAVDTEHITAKMQDGVLTITLPKRVEKVGRKIDVK